MPVQSRTLLKVSSVAATGAVALAVLLGVDVVENAILFNLLVGSATVVITIAVAFVLQLFGRGITVGRALSTPLTVQVLLVRAAIMLPPLTAVFAFLAYCFGTPMLE